MTAVPHQQNGRAIDTISASPREKCRRQPAIVNPVGGHQQQRDVAFRCT
ncbi:hypothetical protein ACLK17_18910 [Escherichia coli]